MSLSLEQVRRDFNAAWTPARYAEFLGRLTELCGMPVPFRICETPCFIESGVLNRMVTAGRELVAQLMTPEYHALSEATLPEKYRVPNEAERPMFVQADFGVVRNEKGEFQPKLVEIQGFPSLYAFQPALARAYRETYGLPADLNYYINGFTDETYPHVLRRAIVGGHDPQNVILLEIDPDRQKTRPDFLLTEKMTGVRAVCITKLVRRGRKLHYVHDGVETPVHRIYNRCIVDELERKGVEPPFDFRDDLDVEWAGHPNWYFRISKFSLPHLRHPSVPQTWFLDQIPSLPADLENYVLKPLYSFAGLGVVVGPSRAEVDAVPKHQRHDWVLQERVHFDPCMETPHGPTKAEFRIMYLWLDRLDAVTTIVRCGRGKMMGVDQNKNMEWVGASAALHI